MQLDLKDKGFLVLGASRGLGYGVAEALVEEGARVIVAARNPEAVEAAATRLGDAASGLVCDVASPDIEGSIAAVDEHLETLDGILLNSGGPPAGPALSLSEEDWQLAFQLLIGGPLALLRALRPKLATPASILWITSSSVRQPIPNLDTSNLLRPGIAALVKSLARDLGPDIRVNSLAPGRFDTDRVRQLDSGRAEAQGISPETLVARTSEGIPLGRYGDPIELGRMAAFLLSPAASYITGTSNQVDGGLVTSVP